MLCVDVVCGVCERITVIKLTNGVHFCSNKSCGATLLISDGISVQIKNDSYVRRSYECE